MALLTTAIVVVCVVAEHFYPVRHFAVGQLQLKANLVQASLKEVNVDKLVQLKGKVDDGLKVGHDAGADDAHQHCTCSSAEDVQTGGAS